MWFILKRKNSFIPGSKDNILVLKKKDRKVKWIMRENIQTQLAELSVWKHPFLRVVFLVFKEEKRMLLILSMTIKRGAGLSWSQIRSYLSTSLELLVSFDSSWRCSFSTVCPYLRWLPISETISSDKILCRKLVVP